MSYDIKNFTQTFFIDHHRKITIKSEIPFNVTQPNHKAIFSFVHGSEQKILNTGYIHQNLKKFINLLQDALAWRLDIRYATIIKKESKDIGYLHNELLQNRLMSTKKNPWVGINYNLWTDEYAFWIYNSQRNWITLKITPIYPYNLSTNPTNNDEYKKWLENYESYYYTSLSREIVYQWIAQAKLLLFTLEKNR